MNYSRREASELVITMAKEIARREGVRLSQEALELLAKPTGKYEKVDEIEIAEGRLRDTLLSLILNFSPDISTKPTMKRTYRPIAGPIGGLAFSEDDVEEDGEDEDNSETSFHGGGCPEGYLC